HFDRLDVIRRIEHDRLEQVHVLLGNAVVVHQDLEVRVIMLGVDLAHGDAERAHTVKVLRLCQVEFGKVPLAALFKRHELVVVPWSEASFNESSSRWLRVSANDAFVWSIFATSSSD